MIVGTLDSLMSGCEKVFRVSWQLLGTLSSSVKLKDPNQEGPCWFNMGLLDSSFYWVLDHIIRV